MGMGWVAGIKDENQDLGVICRAPQSPVGEEGEGEGGRQGQSIITNI